MSFWLNVLFDEESLADEQELGLAEFRTSQARTEVRHWLERNSRMCAKARLLLQDYHQNLSHKPPGKLAAISPLAWNWLPEGSVEVLADDPAEDSKHAPQWDEEETDNFKQDQAYGRVSREVDTWWLKVRDTNYDEWVVPMPSVDFAQVRAETSKATLSSRYAHTYRADDQEGSITDEDEDGEPEEDGQHGVYGHLDATEPSPEGTAAPSAEQDGADEDVHGHPHHVQDYVDDLGDEEDLDDDDSYGEGPMTGLLTEVPNILNPKEIEALHMIVKSCILDSAGMGLTRAGENLQKTRCRMLLALDCGKSLLREMLVFIAVWEKDETTLIFQITSQIVEAIHHSALIPYAWQSLRIPKDIISPAQTVLLRLIDHIFRSRSSSPSTAESKENLRDVKLLHFLFIQFRSRIVPECIALMYLQEEIRNGKCNPHDFPVDTWDMERAKDGLHQFLEFLNSVCVFPETRSYLVQWEASYELIALLKALEAGVPRKPLVDLPDRSASRPAPSAPENMDGTAPASAPLPNRDAWRHDVATGQAPPPPPPPPLPHQEEAYSFPWSGIKAYVLSILAELLQPPAGKSTPGNPDVQAQIVKHNGIVPLLNCCVYDDHNRYARERVQICLKWLMDGSQSANDFLRNLVHSAAPPRPQPASPPTSGPVSGQPPPPTLSKTTTLRVDGIAGELKVQVGPLAKPPTGLPVTGTPGHHGPSAAGGSLSHPTASSSAAHTSRAPPPASAASAAAAAAARATAPLRPPHMSPAEYLSELQDMLATHASNAGVTLPPIQIREGQVTFGQSGVKTSAAFAAMAAAAAAAPQGALGKPEELLRDIITLADEAARFALGQGADAEETEEEEFM